MLAKFTLSLNAVLTAKSVSQTFRQVAVEIADNPVTTEKVDTFALQAITSVNKRDIIKSWREQLMTLLPVVQQHEMVPFHERFLSTLFKEEGNIEKMRERLIERADRSTHWLKN